LRGLLGGLGGLLDKLQKGGLGDVAKQTIEELLSMELGGHVLAERGLPGTAGDAGYELARDVGGLLSFRPRRIQEPPDRDTRTRDTGRGQELAPADCRFAIPTPPGTTHRHSSWLLMSKAGPYWH